MSLLRGRQERGTEIGDAIRRGRTTSGMDGASMSDAMRVSAVWAILRLRADVESSMPLDGFNYQGDVQVPAPLPAVLREDLLDGSSVMEWRYASRVDLDSRGNTVAIIHKLSQYGKPEVLEPVSMDNATVKGRGAHITGWKLNNKWYQPSQVWHERQYVMTGVPLGLSALGHAAFAAQTSLSAQQFASAWFTGTKLPAAHLKNTARTLRKNQSANVKARFKADTANGDLFVTGSDWELKMTEARASDAGFLEQQNASTIDICRFLGAPGDLIDAPTQGSAITYANVTQRNLQFLVINMDPAIGRRDNAFGRGLTPGATFVKHNRGSLLQMDLPAQYAGFAIGLEKRFLAPSEVRRFINRAPLTPDQIAEFDVLFAPKPNPATVKELV